jgi:hypothetical protein
MALKITSSGLFTKTWLKVQSDGVKFCEAAVGSSKRHFRFSQIECILMSPDNKLSFQVGKEIFSIPINPANQKHQSVMATFVSEVQRAGTGWTGG